MNSLLKPFENENLSLQNKMVMSPMTRSRATADHVPTAIMAKYYAQRSGAGLIITEGTSPSPNGDGYPRIPGIYSAEQTEAWKAITQAAHDGGAKIFLQIMHTGRVSHPDNFIEGGEVIAPSAIAPATTQMYTDQNGPQAIPVPKEMTKEDIASTIEEYVTAAKNAVEAGFDGVELHGANGYLLEQFVNPSANQRTDEYGGSVENRSRFVLEVAERTVAAIGKEKVGIRLSPNGAFNDIVPFEGQAETFDYLSKELNKLGLVYIHLVNHAAMGAPALPDEIRDNIRANFSGILILSGGYNKERAEIDLGAELGDLIAFGRPFLSNPDLPKRFELGTELNDPDFGTFYTPGEKGYTDYPAL